MIPSYVRKYAHYGKLLLRAYVERRQVSTGGGGVIPANTLLILWLPGLTEMIPVGSRKRLAILHQRKKEMVLHVIVSGGSFSFGSDLLNAMHHGSVMSI